MNIKNKVGSFLRKNLPNTYYTLTETPFKKHREETYTCVGNFKDYFYNRKIPLEVEVLTSGMDDYSIHTVNTVILRLQNLPEARYGIKATYNKQNALGGLLNEELEQYSIRKIKKEFKLKLPSIILESSVFKYHHGLTLLPKETIEYIKNGDFIDGGAFIGDSALTFHRYKPNKVFSIEMSKFSIRRYHEIMKKHNIPKDKYSVVNCGIGRKKSIIEIPDTGRLGMSTSGKGKHTEKFPIINVEIKSLDDIVFKYNIKPKFIKLDIEGAALDAVIGGIKTIKEYRPVLSIGIYHNPDEFFKIKPFLEEHLEDYTFMIRKLETKASSINTDVTLLAFPNSTSI